MSVRLSVDEVERRIGVKKAAGEAALRDMRLQKLVIAAMPTWERHNGMTLKQACGGSGRRPDR